MSLGVDGPLDFRRPDRTPAVQSARSGLVLSSSSSTSTFHSSAFCDFFFLQSGTYHKMAVLFSALSISASVGDS